MPAGSEDDVWEAGSDSLASLCVRASVPGRDRAAGEEPCDER
jgi:hypothetical protein